MSEASTAKIYDKLIEVSERLAGLTSSYEEGKNHAIEYTKRNDEAHQAIVDRLERKADIDDVRTWVWIQRNPRIIFVLLLMFAGGTAATGSMAKLFKWLAGAI